MARWTVEDIPDQSGRTALVTGANSGLGLRTAEALASRGARVLLACRHAGRAATACDAVGRVATGDKPEVVSLDLADLSSVRQCAGHVNATVGSLDVLMNNAGVMTVPLGRTADGFERQFGVNHLGHFALTGLLLPALLRAAAPRVVTTSSVMAHMGRIRWDDPNWERGRYGKWRAYAQSKLANQLFTMELARRSAEAGGRLLALAAHPGYARTHLQAASTELTGNRMLGTAFDLGNRVLAQSDRMGALPQLWAATAPEAVNGGYVGPDTLFGSRGWPTAATMVRAARPEDAGRLWGVSERLTGVTYSWDTARA